MHTLILGMTESGKSTLAKLLASTLLAQGKRVAVLDPIFDPAWKATFKTDDIYELREWAESNRNAYIFIDESGEVFNEGNDTEHSWFATRSRHYGHSVFFLAQRAIQVPKTMRDQCGKLFVFTSSSSDGVIHSEEWNKQELRGCNKLEQLHFYSCTRFGQIQKMRIVDFKRVENVTGNGSDIRNTRNTGNDSVISGKVDKRKGKK